METIEHTIGAELQKARQEKDLSLEMIAEKTRISSEYLQKIEAGEFDFLPRPYVTAYIKLFASLVELPGDELVRRWDEARSKMVVGESSAVPPARALQVMEPNLTEENQRTYIREISIGVALVTILLVVLYVLQEQPEAETAAQVQPEKKQEETIEIKPIPFEDTPAPAARKQTQPGTAETRTVQPEQPAPILEENIRLRIQAVDTVWVAVTDADGEVEEAIFRPGDVRTWKGPNFIVNIGNAAGLKLFLDGEDQGSLGRKGQVRIFEVTREGLKPRRARRSVPSPQAGSDSSQVQ